MKSPPSRSTLLLDDAEPPETPEGLIESESDRGDDGTVLMLVGGSDVNVACLS
jgi:hypothetical protein